MFKFFTKTFILLIFSFRLYSQSVDSTFAAPIKAEVMKSLLANGQSLLYNGFNFYGYAPNFFETGFPFFQEQDWIKGYVDYDGIKYHQVSLKYDLLTDELIVQHFDGLSSINLVKSKVKDFNISGHRFIHLQQTDSLLKIPSGFYEELYNKKLILLAKRTKTVGETISQAGVKRNILISNRYFVYKDGQFLQYKSLSSLSKILKNRKKELSQYVKTNKKQFKNEPEKAMVAIATYYDQLQK